jgi:hypothetical protein
MNSLGKYPRMDKELETAFIGVFYFLFIYTKTSPTYRKNRKKVKPENLLIL